jgi:hypothetical protein
LKSIGIAGKSSPAAKAEVRGNGNIAVNSQGNFFVSSGGTAAQAAEAGGQISFGAWLNGDLSVPYPVAAIRGVSESATTDTNKGALIFATMNNTTTAERMRITSAGNVLIGTTSSPSAYGLVAIRGTNQGLTIQDAVSNGYRSLYFQSGNLYFYNGTNEGYLSSGGTWVNASDITLKKDVKEIEYGLKEVMELKPKWYRMIEDDLEQIGFIAQDVEEVLPELVSTSEKGMKGLSYGNLTAVLVKAIQELKSEVEELKQIVATK